MLNNHLFWLAIVLFFCSAININVFLEYHKKIRILPSIIGLFGLFGLIGWSVRVFVLSMTFNWWWLLGVGGGSLLFTGIFAYFTQDKLSLVLGSINILVIPLLWWWGSKFNSIYNFDWFYDIWDAVGAFFS